MKNFIITITTAGFAFASKDMGYELARSVFAFTCKNVGVQEPEGRAEYMVASNGLVKVELERVEA